MTTPNTQGDSWEDTIKDCFLTERDTSNGWPIVTVNPDTLLFTVQGLLSKERAEGERSGMEKTADYIYRQFKVDGGWRFPGGQELTEIFNTARTLPTDNTESVELMERDV